jgi:hypothetical protein
MCENGAVAQRRQWVSVFKKEDGWVCLEDVSGLLCWGVWSCDWEIGSYDVHALWT